MNKKLLLIIVLITCLFRTSAFSQCTVNANASKLNIICGQSVTLSHVGTTPGNVSFSENFNNGTATGWAFTQQATFTNPCSPNGVDGTTHIWMGSQSSAPRALETLPLNFGPAVAPAGGTICFDLLMAEQGGNAPCEGPDESDEGVYLQYSIDNGATWVTIHYFNPNGGYDSQLINWNNWCFAIPAAALINGVKFRWFQDADSGAAYDHWGIDNVQIIVNDPNVQYTWSHDGYTTSMPGDNPTPVSPHATTTYTVTMTSSSGTCTANVEVVVTNPDVQVNAGPDLSVCPGQCVDLQGIAKVVNDPGGIKTFSNTQVETFDASIISGASVNVNIQDLNMDNVNPGSLLKVCISNLKFTGLNLPPSGVETLSLKLTCPGGASVILVPQGSAPSGLAGQSPYFPPLGSPPQASYYQNVCFVPSGGINISSISSNTSAAVPITGNINSNQPFSNIDGCLANGTWSISVTTSAFSGSGTFDGWSITFDDEEDSYIPDITWSPTTYMSPGEESTLTPTVCPTVNTAYTLTASDTAGCVTVSDIVNVTTDGVCCALTIDSVNVTNPPCGSSNGTITIYVSGQTTNVQYSINNGQTFQPSNVFTGLAGGNYSIRVIDDSNCPVNGTATIQSSSAPVINNISSTNATCSGNDGSITIHITGSTTGFEYSINNGQTFQSGNVFNNVGAGNYNVVVKNSSGCTTNGTVTVQNDNAPAIDQLNKTDETCNNNDGTITVQASGGTGTLTYSIDGTNFQSGTSFNGLNDGNYTVTVKDAGGCTTTGQIQILPGDVPVITTTTTPPSCGQTDGTITVNVTGGTAPYNYSLGSGSSQTTSTFTNLGAGNYVVTVTDDLACTATANVALTTSQQPAISISGNTTVCAGQSTTLTASGGTSYSWTTGGSTPSITVNPTVTTSYSVTGTDASGCTGVANVTVTVLPDPNAAISSNVDTGYPPLEVVFTNASSNANTYAWNFGNGQTSNSGSATVSATYTAPGQYEVILVASNGLCSDTATTNIIVLGFPEIVINIPNVFTPNGDGANEEFLIETHYAKTVYVEIFNRWGNLMAKLENATDTWDGNGASDGVYFYKYRITDLKDEVHEGHGFFHLVRKK